MRKKGLEWNGEKHFYPVHVICRVPLAVVDLCGWAPCSGSSVGCWVICCVYHVGSEWCGRKFTPQLASSDPVCHLLPCTICISACIPSRWCTPGYLVVFTKPMGNAWLLAIPNSGCLWCSFPLSYQHLHLLPSPVGSPTSYIIIYFNILQVVAYRTLLRISAFNPVMLFLPDIRFHFAIIT